MISERQNSEINIQRLAAQRNLYRKAKRLHLFRFVLTIPLILTLSIITSLLKSEYIANLLKMHTYDASWGLALLSLVIFIIDRLILEPIQQKQKLEAAAIQEEFDCDVLQIPWNDVELPKRPSRETIISNAKHCISKYGDDQLQNWYAFSENDFIPLAIARFICQRSNVSYDKRLRQRYVLVVSVLGFVVSVIIFVVAAVYDLSFRGFLSNIIAPLLPAAGFVVGEIRQNKATIHSLDEIRDFIEKLWKTILSSKLSSNELLFKARQLQNRIYLHRKGCPLIPDWMYERLRTTEESLMTETANQMKEEYLAQQCAPPDRYSAGAP